MFQTGVREIPTYPGDEGSGQHAGQPKWCQAKSDGTYKANCGMCERTCTNGVEDSKCKTYCRPTACRCHPECITGMQPKQRLTPVRVVAPVELINPRRTDLAGIEIDRARKSIKIVAAKSSVNGELSYHPVIAARIVVDPHPSKINIP